MTVKKLFKIAIVSILVLGNQLALSFNLFDRPKVITALDGIEINALENDILIRKGQPNRESDITSNDHNTQFYKSSDYWDDNAQLRIARDILDPERERKTVIHYQGTDENNFRVERICKYKSSNNLDANGIQIGDNIDELLDRLGKPSSTDTSSDRLSAIYNFAKYHLYFTVRNGRIVDFCVTNGGNYSFSK